MAILYIARLPAQRVLREGAALVVRLSARLARSGRRVESRARRGARRALLGMTREAAERRVNRRISLLETTLSRDLASFPHLHRQLQDQIQRVDEDFRSTVEAPPTPPEWLQAIETMTRLPAREDPTVGRMLEDLRSTLDRACHEALLAYRAASQRRHRILKQMQPIWRRMDRRLGSLYHTMNRLQSHTDRLDRQIADYNELMTAKPRIARRLAAGFGSRCVLTIMALAGIGLAATVAFRLVADPLAMMGAGTGPIGPFTFPTVTAVGTLALLAISGGVVLESFGVTRLFPETGWSDPRVRNAVGNAATVLLVALLLIMAALAWTRDYFLNSQAGTYQLQPGLLLEAIPVLTLPEPAVFQWLPALLHSLLAIGMGAIVAVVALPLESLLRQGRIVALGVTAVLGRGVALLGELLAIAISQLTRFVISLYDLVIIIPLAIEAALHRLRHQQADPTQQRSQPARPALDAREANAKAQDVTP